MRYLASRRSAVIMKDAECALGYSHEGVPCFPVSGHQFLKGGVVNVPAAEYFTAQRHQWFPHPAGSHTNRVGTITA